MKAHTPGPWTYELLEEGHQIRMGTALADSGSYLVHHTIMYEHGLFPAYEDGEPVPQRQFDQFIEAEANARLIAAGPDMLEALKEARAQLQYMREVMQSVGSFYPNADSECESRLAVIEAAISKAEGGTDE